MQINLVQANLEVISAKNGAEGLRKASSEKPDVILLDTDLPDLDNTEVCRQLKESPQTCHIPIILIGSEGQKNSKALKLANSADSYIAKPFDPKEVVSLVQTYLRRKERAAEIDSQTGLPNGTQISREITRLIEENKNFAAIYLDIDKLKIFNKTYGFAHGNTAIRLLADIAIEAVRRLGNPEDLVGHLGGDDFMVITTTRKAKTLCRRIIAEFDRRKRTLYPQEDFQKGYIERESQLSGKDKHPIMSLHAAVVTNEKSLFRHFFEVSKAASEQINRLKSFAGSHSYFDIADDNIEPDADISPKALPQKHRQDSKIMYGVLAWFSALTGDIKSPVMAMDDSLQQIESEQPENRSPRGLSILASARESVNRLIQIVGLLESLITTECPLVSSVPDEANLDGFISWIVKQVRGQTEQRGIAIDIQAAGSTEQLIVDGKSLAQSLLYLLRAMVEMSASGDRVQIGISEKHDEFITLQIANPNHYIGPRVLARLQRNLPEGVRRNAIGFKIYPAKLLVQGLGGSLSITSEKEHGTIIKIIIPRKWQSWIHELNALVFATSASRKQARAELENIRQLLCSSTRKVPAAFEDSLDRLRSRIQELGILCNRSLYLAEDFSSRLEKQQERWMQQEIEQISTSEAILTISREIAQRLHTTGYFFDVESTQRVAKNALAIANEFNMSQNDLKELHHAALLKDLGLALSAQHIVRQMVVPTIEEAIIIKACFSPMWKALSMIPFLSRALDIVLYRNEKYNGTDGRFGVKGVNIPLGTRIIAVAEAFDSMTSGLSPLVTLAPNLAVKKILSDSGICFDPDVVNAFLRTWRRKELFLAQPGPSGN